MVPISYIEKGSGLHDAVRAAGYSLWSEGLNWFADDPAVQAIVNSYDPMPAARLVKFGALAAQTAAQIGKGVAFGGHIYQVDPTSTANINAMGALAIGVLTGAPGAAPWPTGFAWIDATNVMVPMSAAAMYAFSQTAAAYVSAIIFNGRFLKNAIAAAPTTATLNAIDLTVGWP